MKLIASRAFYWWRFLPVSVRNWYDADDMLSDAVLHVFKRASRYNPAVAMESTWVRHVTDNYCVSILCHHKARKYSDCDTIEMTDDVIQYCPAAASPKLLRESKDAVERVIEVGSDLLQEFLNKIFNGGRITVVPYHDMLVACRRAGATFEDFNRVYRAVVD